MARKDSKYLDRLKKNQVYSWLNAQTTGSRQSLPNEAMKKEPRVAKHDSTKARWSYINILQIFQKNWNFQLE